MNTDNTSAKADEQPRPRGRRPIGNRAMTGAERVRRSRDHMRQAGRKTFTLNVGSQFVMQIEEAAHANGTSASEALQLLIEDALTRFMVTRRLGEAMYAAGANDEQVAAEAIRLARIHVEALNRWTALTKDGSSDSLNTLNMESRNDE